ncbi:MAG: hypothetical protein AAGA56_25350 [Myxococcota bacterium]
MSPFDSVLSFRLLGRGAVAASLLSLALAGGCTKTVFVDDDDDDGGSSSPGEPRTPTVAAAAQITKITINQGVERVLMEDGTSVSSDLPIIAGRPALVRVFYSSGASGAAIRGRVTLGEEAEPIDVDATLVAQSTEDDLNSTVNFELTAEQVVDMLAYRVELLAEVGSAAATESGAGSVYPAQGRQELLVDGVRNRLRVVMVPFQYNADGSGRLPDMSEERIEQTRQRFLSLYPVSGVDITVRASVPWGGGIGPDGSGWQEVGFRLAQIRQAEAEPDQYFYGIFNPTRSVGEFCGRGCLLGVTLLNSDPVDEGNEQLRLALGVGFDEVGIDTAAHELGHSHGRQHAPCAPGNQIDSVDPEYPHPGGVIGVWGWDIVQKELKAPDFFTDVMGYCDNQWISDHNFLALYQRSRFVNQPDGADRIPHTIIGVDGEGHTQWVSEGLKYSRLLTGHEPLKVALADGSTETRYGRFFRYDHLPGGWILVPGGKEMVGIEGEIGGVYRKLSR